MMYDKNIPGSDEYLTILVRIRTLNVATMQSYRANRTIAQQKKNQAITPESKI